MKILIPTPLQPFAGGQNTVEVAATTVALALKELTDAYADLRKHLFTPEGKVRAFVNLYLNDEDVRYLPENQSTRVSEKDTLTIIPSIAGGLGDGQRSLRNLTDPLGEVGRRGFLREGRTADR